MIDFICEVIGSLYVIVDVLSLLCAGITFGIIKLPSPYNNELADDRATFIIRVTHCYTVVAFTYFSAQATISLFYGYYHIFEFVTSFLGWALVIAVALSMRRTNDKTHFHAALSGLAVILIIKLCHTSFYCTDLILLGVRDGTYIFLMTSLMVEIVLTMFCTLIPYLHIEDVDEEEEEEEKQKDKRHAFNIWGMEIFDMVSQIVVIQTYCRLYVCALLCHSAFVPFCMNMVTELFASY